MLELLFEKLKKLKDIFTGLMLGLCVGFGIVLSIYSKCNAQVNEITLQI